MSAGNVESAEKYGPGWPISCRNLEGLYLALNDLITKEGRNADIINASRDSAKKADLKHISQKYFAKMDALDTIISKQKYP